MYVHIRAGVQKENRERNGVTGNAPWQTEADRYLLPVAGQRIDLGKPLLYEVIGRCAKVGEGRASQSGKVTLRAEE